MLFRFLKKSFKMPLGQLLIVGSCIMGLSGCYGDNCCLDYTPEHMDNPNDADAYKQMCYNSMIFDDKYNMNSGCYLKEVDRYIDAAKSCCAPLKDVIQYQEFETWQGKSAIESFFSEIVLSAIPGCGDLCYSMFLPTNAYTYCLYNTHPRTYQCDIEKAKQFENDLNQCCTNASDSKSCKESFLINDGVCIASCCEGLPDHDNEQYISKDNCLKVLKESNECIETPIDACCRIAPKESSDGHIDRYLCKQIYTESNGQCVNTDEKYVIYKNQSE